MSAPDSIEQLPAKWRELAGGEPRGAAKRLRMCADELEAALSRGEGRAVGWVLTMRSGVASMNDNVIGTFRDYATALFVGGMLYEDDKLSNPEYRTFDVTPAPGAFAPAVGAMVALLIECRHLLADKLADDESPDGWIAIDLVQRIDALATDAGEADIRGRKIGKYRVTVAENAITISEGRKIVFVYDGDDDAAPTPRTPAMNSEHVTHEQANLAIDSLDDFARMECGVDPKGPRELLIRYVAQQAALAALGGDGEPAGYFILYRGKPVGYATPETKDDVRLAECETMVPVYFAAPSLSAPSGAVAWYAQSACGGPIFVDESKDSVEQWIERRNSEQERQGVSLCYRQKGPFPLTRPQPAVGGEILDRLIRCRPAVKQMARQAARSVDKLGVGALPAHYEPMLTAEEKAWDEMLAFIDSLTPEAR